MPARGRIAALLGALLVASAAAPARAQAPPPAAPPADQGRAPGAAPPAPAAQGHPPGAARPAPALPLPRGGDRLFPAHRVVAFAGAPRAPNLGELGVGRLSGALRRLEAQALPYGLDGRRVLPALDLITVIATRGPGRAGLFRKRLEHAEIERHLRAARAARALLLLDIQPARSTFLREVRAYRRFLREPDVGIALDPEWNVGRYGRPGRTTGRVSAAEVNAVAAELGAIVAEHRLPEKLLVVHAFTPRMVPPPSRLVLEPGVALTVSVDAIGTAAGKRRTYGRIARPADGVFDGFKLFYAEDAGLMPSRAVLGLRPVPDLVIYE